MEINPTPGSFPILVIGENSRAKVGFAEKIMVPSLFLVQRRAQHSDHEMGEVRSFIVELNPANHAMLLQIIADFGLADFEMLGELRLERGPGALATPAASAHKLPERDSQRLTGFRIVGSDEIRIRDQENAWTGRSVIGFF